MTKHDLVSVLARLSEIAPEINKATDDATAAVRAVEGFLRELNLGIDSWHTYETETPSKNIEIRRGLVYMRVKGEFRIGVQTVWHTVLKNEHGLLETRNREEEVVSWDNCARDVKIRAFPALPDLLVAMAKKAERTLEETKAAAKAVSKVLAAAGSSESRSSKTTSSLEEAAPETHEDPERASKGAEAKTTRRKNKK
jgi:hypothetical protein